MIGNAWLTTSTVLPLRRHGFHLGQAFLLKARIADGQGFVDDEDFGFEMSGDREGQTHVHAARIMLDRGIQKLADFGKLDDGIEPIADFTTAHADHGPIEENVVSARQIGMKAGADFEQRTNPAMHDWPSLRSDR